MTAGKRLTSALVATVLSVSVVAGVGVLLHKLSADPNGTLVATKEADTITIDGKVYPKASLTMGVYADKEQAKADGFTGNKNESGTNSNVNPFYFFNNINKLHIFKNSSFILRFTSC